MPTKFLTHNFKKADVISANWAGAITAAAICCFEPIFGLLVGDFDMSGFIAMLILCPFIGWVGGLASYQYFQRTLPQPALSLRLATGALCSFLGVAIMIVLSSQVITSWSLTAGGILGMLFGGKLLSSLAYRYIWMDDEQPRQSTVPKWHPEGATPQR